MDAETQKRIRSRRTHRKSKLGCGNCKKRRVKCDEKKPECNNCLQHSIPCDFQSPSSRSPSESSTPPQRFQFRQSKYSLAHSSKEQPKDENSRSIGVQCTTPSLIPGDLSVGPSDGISLRDLHLFHHFITSTSLTIADKSPDAHKVWQIHVPEWGFSFRSILHLMLTLSSLHLASSSADRKDEHVQQADEHFTFGVRSVTSVLALDTLDSENCQRIYIAAVMICFAYFARGPREGEYLVFNQRGKSEWLVLLHGVRAILHQKQSAIFTGVLAPSMADDNMTSLNPDLEIELSRHIQRLEEVKAMVTSEIGADRDIYARTVDDLIGSFKEAYKLRRPGYPATMLMPCTIGWTFRLHELMISRLENREPIALVILAHWAILLRYMRDAWFMRGWDRHIILGIRACLPESYYAWIEWPEEVTNIGMPDVQ